MKKSSIAVIGLFLLLYILPLGVRPIVIPDESRYAEVAREMLVSGDWVVPHLNGVRYFEKPVLDYWLNALSVMLFGENAFAIRFPSAVAVGVSALILFLLVKRFAGGYSAGLLAAAVLLTCLEVFGVGTFSVLDSTFSMFATAAMVSFFFAYMEWRPKKRAAFLALFGVFCGLAFLTKGFIAFAIPVVAIVPFLIWERGWKKLVKICWLPLVFALLVSFPWAVMVHLREPDFWHFFFWNEHIRRFMSDSAQHNKSLWYFFLLFPGAALPWTFLFPAVISGMKQMRFENPVIRFAICWFLLPFLFFSASNGKLLTYILPCFPPLAILITTGLHNYFMNRGRKAFLIGALLFSLVTAIFAVTLASVQIAGPDGFKPFAQTWKWGLTIAAFLSWTLFLLFSVRQSDDQKKIILYGAAPILFMFSTSFLVPDLIRKHKAPGEFLLHYSHSIRPDTILVSDKDLVGSVCWFYKQSDVYVLGGGGELSYGLHYDDSKHRLLSPDQFRRLVLKNRGTGRVILVARARKYKDWMQSLPKRLFEDSNGNVGFVFARF